MRANRVPKCERSSRSGLPAVLGLLGVVLVLLASAMAAAAQTDDDLDKQEFKKTMEDPADSADKESVDQATPSSETSTDGATLKHKVRSLTDSGNGTSDEPDGPDQAGEPDQADPERDGPGDDDPQPQAERGGAETDPVDDWDPAQECHVPLLQQTHCSDPESTRGGAGDQEDPDGQSTQSSGDAGPPATGEPKQAKTQATVKEPDSGKAGQTALQAASGSGLAILLAWTLFVASAGSYDRSRTRLEKRDQEDEADATQRRMRVPRHGAAETSSQGSKQTHARTPHERPNNRP